MTPEQMFRLFRYSYSGRGTERSVSRVFRCSGHAQAKPQPPLFSSLPMPDVPDLASLIRTINPHNSDYRKCPPRPLGSPESDDDQGNVEMAQSPTLQVDRLRSPWLLAPQETP